VALLAGCSGRTTGATDIGAVISRTEFYAFAKLNAVGSCDQHCTFFMRWRRSGTTAWTNGGQHSVGAIGRTAWHENVTGLDVFESYEYQACGKEDSYNSVVCVGPNGKPGTTQKFATGNGTVDWPQFGYATDHSGVNPAELTLDTGNVSKLEEAWAAPLSNATSPSVVNGVLYVGGRSQAGTGIVAAYPATCEIGGAQCTRRLWSANVGQAAIRSEPAVVFNSLYIGSEDGKVYSLDTTDGSRLWTGSTGGPIRSSPTAGPGLVYIGSEDGSVYAFPGPCNAGTCQPHWKTATGGAVTSSPAIDPLPGQSGGRVFAGSADHKVYAFHQTDGQVLWTGSTGGAIRSSPAVANGVVYVGSDDGKLYAFQSDCVAPLGNCPVLWSAATGGPISSSPALDQPGVGGPTTVYVGSSDGRLYAYSATCDVCSGGGQLKWTGATGGAVNATPTVANGVVYVGSADGKLYGFRAAGCGAATCQPLFTATTAGLPSSPAIAGGQLYFRDTSGVHAYALP
jgi:outer membrane protein assembly factor BamB